MIAALSRRFVMFCLALLLACAVASPASAAGAGPGAFARVTLLEPAGSAYVVQIEVLPGHGAATNLSVGKAVAAQGARAATLRAGEATPWIDLHGAITRGVASVRFVFSDGKAPLKNIKARFDVATAANDAAIVRSITEHDPGDIISLRIPADLVKDKKWLLSIREDAQRRLAEIKALNLPDGPMPRKIWCMTGFRSNGQFYTDPEIAKIDFDIIQKLGMNGWWEQNGGQPGGLRTLAAEHGINRTTVYWRMIENLRQNDLDWPAIERATDDAYRGAAIRTRESYAKTSQPEMVVDLMDEPDGLGFGNGPGYQKEFRAYLQQRGFAPDFFGKKSWDEVASPPMNWRSNFETRGKVAVDLPSRRLFYWALEFWNYVNARIYAMETRKAEQYAPGILGTRLNFGPPWFYDYGSLPRGTEAFDYGKMRSISLGFNEDWVGGGNTRIPLEVNTYLMDFSRAAAYPAQPLIGSYVTADANRTSVKLRTFGLLARQAKIFDFYYYGPAYTFFDHWSDNFPMVRGVAELTRDLGQVDDILWEGQAPRAEVALLYSRSWPVWKEDDTEQNEMLMVYLALLHAGVPVDLVSDEQIVNGQFTQRNYKALYVVNESIPAAVAPVVEHWVREGGRLWAAGWAGMKDEYNTPTEAWNGMLGAKSRSWKPTGDLSRLGKPIEVADWRRPIFGRDVTIEVAMGGAEGGGGMKHLTFKGGTAGMGAYERMCGGGVVEVVPWAAGKAYQDGAKEQAGKLAKAVLFPAEGRHVMSDFALEAKVQPPATVSVDQVLAWPLWTHRNGVVLLANFSGEPAAEATVRFSTTLPVAKVRSLHHGELKFTRAGEMTVEVKVPVDDVTDILVVE